MRRLVLLTALLGAALPAPVAGQGGPLSFPDGGAWRPLWTAESPPARWTAPHPAVTRAVRWRPSRSGVETAELRLAGPGEAWRVRAVLVRFNPRRVRIALEEAVTTDGLAGAWTVDAAPPAAAVAFNAGQFSAGTPWGWTVRDGRETAPPGRGPLSMAFVVDAAGRVRLVGADSVAAVRRAGGVVSAFQSYPTLLDGEGEVPAPLRAAGRGVDLAHRDARLGLCTLRDGLVLVMLTRFDGLGGALASVPLGLTVPELAGVMGALGCRRAVALDGGISGQLAVRDARGRVTRHAAWRRVPLGVVAVPRTVGR